MANQIAYEALTVSTAAIGPTAATATQLAKAAVFYLELGTGAVRHRADGTSPTASVGLPIESGGHMVVVGNGNILNAEFIRRDGADGTIHCLYYDAVDVVAAGFSGANAAGNLRVSIMESSNEASVDGALADADNPGENRLRVEAVARGIAPDASIDSFRTVGDTAGLGLGVLATSPRTPGASEVKLISVVPTTTSGDRATVATPSGGKKIRLISMSLVDTGLSTDPDGVELYFHTGTNISSDTANAVGIYACFGTVAAYQEWPDGGGPIGDADEVLSWRTTTETETSMRLVVAYREE